MATPKQFKLRADQIVCLIPASGSCLASDQITVQGLPVGFMYREPPDNETDSGWRFLSGKETQEYLDEPGNLAIYDLNTIANYGRAIVAHLNSEMGVQLERIFGTNEFRCVE